MSYYEYVVVPVPKAAPRVKGVKRTDDRFANGLSETLNRYGAEGWEFQRSETLNVEARQGFLSRGSMEQVTVMIFRRWVETGLTGTPVAAGHHRDWPEADPVAAAPASPEAAAPRTPLTASRRPEGGLFPLPRAPGATD